MRATIITNTKIKLVSSGLLFLSFILLLAFPQAVSANICTDITVDINKGPGGKAQPISVNYGVLGNNLLGFAVGSDLQGGSWPVTHHLDGDGVWDQVQKKSNPTMLGYARDTGMSYARFPGGCGIHLYNWKDSVGPILQRPKNIMTE